MKHFLKLYLLLAITTVIASTGLFATKSFPTDLTPGTAKTALVAYWNFDLCDGLNVPDAIATAANGSIVSPVMPPFPTPPALWTSGYNNSCIQYKAAWAPGYDDPTGSRYVSFGTPAKLDFYSGGPVGTPPIMVDGSGFSISCWINTNADDTKHRQIISKGWDGANTQYELKVDDNTSGILTFRAWYSSLPYSCGVTTFSNNNLIPSSPDFKIKKGFWYFVVATYQKNSTTNHDYKLTVYEDEDGNGSWTQHNFQKLAEPKGPWHTSRMVDIGGVNTGTTAMQQFWWDGLIDEVGVYNAQLSPSDISVLFNSYAGSGAEPCGSGTQDPSDDENLVLWYDGMDNANIINTAGKVSTWKDKAFTVSGIPPVSTNQENATMSLAARQPVVATGIGYNNGKQGVSFVSEYGSSSYGLSDIMTSDYNEEITSGEPNEWEPSCYDKTLVVLFKPSTVDNPAVNGTPADVDPYYSDGRKTIFEAGGPLSGFNVYITNGKLGFGMWNRFERKYIVYNSTETGSKVYPMSAGTTYMAILEYDMGNNKFRGSVSVAGAYYPNSGNGNPKFSTWVPFSGLSMDGDDKTAVGGAARTSYYDYNTGETYSDHFKGVIGDVMLFNNFYSKQPAEVDPNYFYNQYLLKNMFLSVNAKYGYTEPNGFHYPEEPFQLSKSSEWKVLEQTLTPNTVVMTEAYPNPFVAKTSFGVNMPSAQPVTVALYDAQGNKIQNIFAGSLSAGIHDFSIDGANLNSGMYIFRVTGQDFVQSGKVILSK